MSEKDEAPTSPFVYLGKDVTTEEHQLAQQVGLHDGAAVPFHMLAKVAVRVHEHGVWRHGWDALVRRARRHLMAVLAATVANIAAMGGYWLHVHDAKVAQEQHLADQERAFNEYRDTVRRELDTLSRQIGELRAWVLKLSGKDPSGSISIVRAP